MPIANEASIEQARLAVAGEARKVDGGIAIIETQGMSNIFTQCADRKVVWRKWRQAVAFRVIEHAALIGRAAGIGIMDED